MKVTERLLHIIRNWKTGDDESALVHFQCNYLSEVTDRAMEDVLDHMKMAWEAVGDVVAARTGLNELLFQTVIEPSLEDSTWSVILFNPFRFDNQGAVMLFWDSTKDSQFCWDSAEAMEEDMERVVQTCIKRLVEANVPMQPSAVLAAAAP